MEQSIPKESMLQVLAILKKLVDSKQDQTWKADFWHKIEQAFDTKHLPPVGPVSVPVIQVTMEILLISLPCKKDNHCLLVYDARSRVCLRKLISSLTREERKAQAFMLFEVEFLCAEWLKGHQSNQPKESTSSKKKNLTRWVKLGAASVAGALAVGLTGGLAAPFIGAGLATVFGAVGIGGLGFLGTAGGAALIGTFFGLSGGGLTAYSYNRRLRDLKEFRFESIVNNENSLNLIISISGWLNTLQDLQEPWQLIPCYSPHSEVHSLVYDSKELLDLGTALKDFVQSTAVSAATTGVLRMTFLSGLLVGLAWPIFMLQLSYLVDNPWMMALNRSKKAGLALAQVLMDHVHGYRPVSLIGYSMGARVIFYCCQELADKEQFGLIDSIYLAGAPLLLDQNQVEKLKKVCCGRIVNGFSTKDWLLGFLYRSMSMGKQIAGLEAIEGMENVDLSNLVQGHLKYRELMPEIMERFAFEQ